MRLDVLVQHRFVIQARQVRHIRTTLNAGETVKFDRENGPEFTEDVEQPLAVGQGGTLVQSHPQGPRP